MAHLSEQEFTDLMHEVWLAYELSQEHADDLVDDYTEVGVLRFRFSLWVQEQTILTLVDRVDDECLDVAVQVKALAHGLISLCYRQQLCLTNAKSMTRSKATAAFSKLKRRKEQLVDRLRLVLSESDDLG
jgi:hypothetical protein